MRIIIALIEFYQKFISPILGPRCRFYPTCSEYTKEVVQNHGYRGLWVALMRIVRCHPFSKGGYDPPPPRRKNV